MKLLFTICLAAVCLSASAQQPTGSPLHYEDVIKVDSTIKQNELYNMGLQWFANSFKSSNDVIQLKDQDTYTIIG